MIWILTLCISWISLSIYLIQFQRAVAEINQLAPLQNKVPGELITISVIVPAYNEAAIIQGCITSVLNGTLLSDRNLELWIVDDQSTDETLTILQTLDKQLGDSRLHVIAGQSRPEDKRWTGKNWACVQAVEQAKGDVLLFMDADVQLKPGALETMLESLQQDQVDLLNCIPEVRCETLVEWLVQPLMFINLLISLNHPTVKNPKTETAYAAGPLMLFRRSAYQQIGGHRVVADQIAEDVALARAIKQQGLKLQYCLGKDLAALRMYRSLDTLWEGWTKVLYVGSQKRLELMLLLITVMLFIYTLPWAGLLLSAHGGVCILNRNCEEPEWLTLLALAIALITITLQYKLRSLAQQAFNCSPKYWWLQGVGGIFVALLAIASVIKTKTGWGWTWRGRSLR